MRQVRQAGPQFVAPSAPCGKAPSPRYESGVAGEDRSALPPFAVAPVTGSARIRSAALKKGERTFAVGPRHAGCTGKVKNCVTGVFFVYVIPVGA